MPLSLSMSDLWKMFEYANHRKAQDKEAIVAWLEAVYQDLEDLSRVWFKMCETLENAYDDGQINAAHRIIQRGDTGRSQFAFAGRLDNFYLSASKVMERQSKADVQFRDDFINSLGNVLLHRNTARKMLDTDFAVWSDDAKVTDEKLALLRGESQRIQQEVVSLQVLIKTFKAIG